MTRGHNVVAEGWAGASNPQSHPNHTPNPPPTHSHTNDTNYSTLNTRFSHFQFERDKWSVTNGWTDKASHRVATKKEISYEEKQARLGKGASGLCVRVY